LPGKALLKINDKTVLQNIILRLKKSKSIKKIIVSTSNKKSDDPIVRFCKKNEIFVFKGSLDHVFNRIKMTSKKFKLNYFLRVCADSPLIDPVLIDRCMKKFIKGNYDIVTNKFPRSYPKGQTVEIIKVSALNNINEKILTSDQKEHFTKYFYDNSKKFRIYNLNFSKQKKFISMALDNKTNFNFLKKLTKKYKDKINDLSLNQLIKIYEKKNI
jgi:spore coat polysaccharide biosynthesis protein SpsF (cytidylyltransferase family)